MHARLLPLLHTPLSQPERTLPPPRPPLQHCIVVLRVPSGRSVTAVTGLPLFIRLSFSAGRKTSAPLILPLPCLSPALRRRGSRSTLHRTQLKTISSVVGHQATQGELLSHFHIEILTSIWPSRCPQCPRTGPASYPLDGPTYCIESTNYMLI